MASKEQQQLSRQLWGLAVAEGVVAILAGLALLLWPGASLVILVVLFGVFVLVWGIVELVKSLLGMGKVSGWWIQLIFSVLVIGLGVFLLRNIEISIATFILLIGFTFIARGIVDLFFGFFSKEKEVRENRAILVTMGVIGIVAGIFVFAQPVASGLAFIWVVGLYAILEGALTLAYAMKTQPES